MSAARGNPPGALSAASATGRSDRAGRTLVLLAVLWIVVLVAAPLVGSTAVSPLAAFDPDSTAGTIVWQLRLPRVLLALLAGGALAVSGMGFQTLFRNGLAEPYTLGVAGGAALGAVLALHLTAVWSGPGAGWLGSEMFGFTVVAAASFAGALAATALVVALALRRRGVETATLLLAGIAVSFSCSALILFIQYLSDSTQTFRMVRWMMGGLAVVGFREVLWLLPWVVAGAGVHLALRWDLNLLLTGEELAASRGVDLGRMRLLILGAASTMVGAMVAVTGPIGFVGLMVPHMLRRWAGSDHLVLTPACLLGGGVFLALCDLAARTVMAPAELPVGVLTALLGGPFFLWLLLARRTRGGSGGRRG